MRLRHAGGLLAALACVLLAACATGYGPKGRGGDGYSEEQVDARTYIVSFKGNGNTQSETVWSFWIYRCAELTKEKGYAAFSLTPVDKKTSDAGDEAADQARELAQADHPGFIKTRGGGTPIYTYVPGQTVTVTTYNSRGIVTMYNPPYVSGAGLLFRADAILGTLKPFVDAKGQMAAPPRREVLEKAAIVPAKAGA